MREGTWPNMAWETHSLEPTGRGSFECRASDWARSCPRIRRYRYSSIGVPQRERDSDEPDVMGVPEAVRQYLLTEKDLDLRSGTSRPRGHSRCRSFHLSSCS